MKPHSIALGRPNVNYIMAVPHCWISLWGEGAHTQDIVSSRGYNHEPTKCIGTCAGRVEHCHDIRDPSIYATPVPYHCLLLHCCRRTMMGST